MHSLRTANHGLLFARLPVLYGELGTESNYYCGEYVGIHGGIHSPVTTCEWAHSCGKLCSQQFVWRATPRAHCPPKRVIGATKLADAIGLRVPSGRRIPSCFIGFLAAEVMTQSQPFIRWPVMSIYQARNKSNGRGIYA